MLLEYIILTFCSGIVLLLYSDVTRKSRYALFSTMLFFILTLASLMTDIQFETTNTTLNETGFAIICLVFGVFSLMHALKFMIEKTTEVLSR